MSYSCAYCLSAQAPFIFAIPAGLLIGHGIYFGSIDLILTAAPFLAVALGAEYLFIKEFKR